MNVLLCIPYYIWRVLVLLNFMSAPKARTFYEILELSRLCKPEEVRTAYISLAKKYHPDSASESVNSSLVQSELHTKFREVQEAYATLSNPWKRTLYDQDLQFRNNVIVSSGDMTWRENFNLETPEARIARRQRYTRYAKGERNDMPPQSLTTRGSLIGLVLGGAFLTWICAKAPEWFGGQGELTYHDPVTDDHSVPLVNSFFNPITRKWERLKDGQTAPTFPELLQQYKKLSPRLIDRWEYEQRQMKNDPSAIDTLTVTKVPKTATSPASVFRDVEGVLHVQRRVIGASLVQFIDKI